MVPVPPTGYADAMASKDKGAVKATKKTAQKSLKDKRRAKKLKKAAK